MLLQVYTIGGYMCKYNIEYKHTISVINYNILRKSVGWSEIKINQAQRGIDNSAFIVSAVIEDKTIGMTRVVSDSGYIVIIVDVIVLPQYQGNGIGKTMMKMVMEYINNSISKGEGIMVNLMAAKGRESFYKKFGFTERPNDKLGAGMTQWIFKNN